MLDSHVIQALEVQGQRLGEPGPWARSRLSGKFQPCNERKQAFWAGLSPGGPRRWPVSSERLHTFKWPGLIPQKKTTFCEPWGYVTFTRDVLAFHRTPLPTPAQDTVTVLPRLGPEHFWHLDLKILSFHLKRSVPFLGMSDAQCP